MQTNIQNKVWTENELMALPDDGRKHELVKGELVVSPAGFEHDRIIMCLAIALGRFVQETSWESWWGPTQDTGRRMGIFVAQTCHSSRKSVYKALAGYLKVFLKERPIWSLKFCLLKIP